MAAMVQRLSLVSMLVLVVLAGAGSVLVATHAFNGGVPASSSAPLLPSPNGASSNIAAGASQATVHVTSTVTITSTNQTSTPASTTVSASDQNSTSSGGGSLLVSGSPSSNSTSPDDGPVDE